MTAVIDRSQCSADQHGTEWLYTRPTNPCRCPDARQAARDNRRRRRHGNPLRTSSVGHVRRLRACAAMGWRPQHLGSKMGWSAQQVWNFLNAPSRTIDPATARKVESVFTELHMTPGPDQAYAKRCRSKGWVTAMAWDDIDSDGRPQAKVRGDKAAYDEVVVHLVLVGRRPRWVREADRNEVIRRVLGHGGDASEAARLLGCATGRVHESIRGLGLEEAVAA